MLQRSWERGRLWKRVVNTVDILTTPQISVGMAQATSEATEEEEVVVEIKPEEDSEEEAGTTSTTTTITATRTITNRIEEPRMVVKRGMFIWHSVNQAMLS